MSTEEQRPREARLHALLRRQDGVISLDQARELGISDQAVRRWVAAGRWYRIAPRVYLVATHEQTPRATVRAAMLSVGDHAVLVGRAAAWWWGLLESRPAPIEIAVDPHRQHRARAGVLLRRRTVPRADRTVVRGCGSRTSRPPCSTRPRASDPRRAPG